jgi:hypothetical protein
VVKRLPSTHKFLGSSPNTTKQTNKIAYSVTFIFSFLFYLHNAFLRKNDCSKVPNQLGMMMPACITSIQEAEARGSLV